MAIDPKRDTWTVKQSWDRRGQPKRLTVTFLPHLYEMPNLEREANITGVRNAVSAFLTEATTHWKPGPT